jgi:hypothetical protein
LDLLRLVPLRAGHSRAPETVHGKGGRYLTFLNKHWRVYLAADEARAFAVYMVRASCLRRRKIALTMNR